MILSLKLMFTLILHAYIVTGVTKKLRQCNVDNKSKLSGLLNHSIWKGTCPKRSTFFTNRKRKSKKNCTQKTAYIFAPSKLSLNSPLGYFRVPKILTFKTRLSAKPFL